MKLIYASLLLTILLIFAACVNKISDDEDFIEKKTITFSVNYPMSGIDSPKPKAVNSLANFASELIFYDYVNGEKRQERSYPSSIENYGHIEVELTDEPHTLVFIAHNAEEASFVYPNLSFDKVKDTFICVTELTIDSKTNPEQPITLARAVGKILVTATDAIPDAATALRITVSTYYPSFDIVAIKASGATQQETRTFVYSSANKGVKNSTYTIYGFANNEKYTTDVTIDLLGVDDNVLYSNHLHNVPLKKNTQTKITGTLFSFVAWSNIAIQSDWDEDIIHSL